METNKLDVISILKEAFALAMKNVIPLIVMVVLFFLTVWIPYLNVATTIGLYKAIVAMSHGETVDPLSLFDKENFAKMGDFFLLMGLMYIGVIVAFCFMFIPGFVISIAWSMAYYFFIEKGIPPLKCLSLSFEVTRGEKWRIFALMLLSAVIMVLIAALFGFIPHIGYLLSLIVIVVGSVYVVAVEALMYRHFSKKAEVMFAEGHHHCCGGGHHHNHEAEIPEVKVEETPAEEPAEPEA